MSERTMRLLERFSTLANMSSLHFYDWQSIDTTTPAGRMMMQMVGSFAEFERAMIRERTKAGLDQARSKGRIGGRRPKLNAKQRAEIAESAISGRKSAAELARIFGVSQPTVSRIVAMVRRG